MTPLSFRIVDFIGTLIALEALDGRRQLPALIAIGVCVMLLFYTAALYGARRMAFQDAYMYFRLCSMFVLVSFMFQSDVPPLSLATFAAAIVQFACVAFVTVTSEEIPPSPPKM